MLPRPLYMGLGRCLCAGQDLTFVLHHSVVIVAVYLRYTAGDILRHPFSFCSLAVIFAKSGFSLFLPVLVFNSIQLVETICDSFDSRAKVGGSSFPNRSIPLLFSTRLRFLEYS